MSKKNEELLQTLQRMEDKLKSLSRENAELVGDKDTSVHTTHTTFTHDSFTNGHTANQCFSGIFSEGEDNLGLPARSAKEDQLFDRPKPRPRGAGGGVSATTSQRTAQCH